jgi:hypothetical protein
MAPKFANLKPEEVIRALQEGRLLHSRNQRLARPDEASHQAWTRDNPLSQTVRSAEAHREEYCEAGRTNE